MVSSESIPFLPKQENRSHLSLVFQGKNLQIFSLTNHSSKATFTSQTPQSLHDQKTQKLEQAEHTKARNQNYSNTLELENAGHSIASVQKWRNAPHLEPKKLPQTHTTKRKNIH